MGLVPKEGLEPSPSYGHAPEACASANSATPAHFITFRTRTCGHRFFRVLCRGWDSNPHDFLESQDFKSCAYTISPPRPSGTGPMVPFQRSPLPKCRSYSHPILTLRRIVTHPSTNVGTQSASISILRKTDCFSL